MNTKRKVCRTLYYLSIISLIIWAVLRISAAVKFDTVIKGYLRNYITAGTVEVAEENLEKAIVELEKQGLTKGQVSVFFKNSSNNVELWYNNLLKSKELLTKASEETAVNQSIILEKQKNAIKGNDGQVKCPKGISIYPYNREFFWWSLLSIVGIILLKLINVWISGEGISEEHIDEK